MAVLLIINAAVVIAGIILLVYYWDEVSKYAAAAIPVIGLAIGLVTAAIRRWQQFQEFAPSVKFGRGTGADTGTNMQGQIGCLGEVRTTVRLLMQFVNENPLERGGRLYHVKIILTIDDLDRCQPSTIAEVMRCIQVTTSSAFPLCFNRQRGDVPSCRLVLGFGGWLGFGKGYISVRVPIA